MCQLCVIKDLAARDRWPKPLEHHKADIDLLMTEVRTELTTFANKKAEKRAPPPDSLLDLLRLLATLLEELENDRQKWWASPEKREQRRRLEEECDQRKLSQLHKINNSLAESFEEMITKLGTVVKWSLNMRGGLWELKEGDKVVNA